MRVDAIRRTILLFVTAAAFAVIAPVATKDARAGGSGGAQARTGVTAEQARARVEAAYRRWRSRLERHDVQVGRNLVAEARVAEAGAAGPTASQLRSSIRRMKQRWTRWLRTIEAGRAVLFKLKVLHAVPAWAKQHLRRIAACDSKGNPRAVGGDGTYRGMYQFSPRTWSVVGGKGDPAAASRHEQTWRAWLLLNRHGPRHWPACG
jgi:hypothetical protein